MADEPVEPVAPKRKYTRKVKAPNALLLRLEQLEATVQRQAAELAARVPDARVAEELRQTQAQLASLKRPEPAIAGVAEVVPYKGFVKAKAECTYGSYHKAGEIFAVDVPALWTDDPYEPVIVTGYEVDFSPKTDANPLAPSAVDFRLRPRSHEALAAADAMPKPASQH